MITYRELVSDFRRLGLDGSRPVIAHASLSAFGKIQGGAETLVGALLAVSKGVIMPTFTYRTMIIPRVGPPHNAMEYGRGEVSNSLAEFFHPDMPADPLMGVTAERLRQHPRAQRSMHPIYSFSGVGAEEALAAQTLEDPFAPIRVLADSDGYVLLLGVDHTANTSIHYGEQLAGRKQFVRWALTPTGVVECPRWPGCSRGFNALAPQIAAFTQQAQVGQAKVQLIPLQTLIETVVHIIHQNPQALLCDRPDCLRCQETRRAVVGEAL